MLDLASRLNIKVLSFHYVLDAILSLTIIQYQNY